MITDLKVLYAQFEKVRLSLYRRMFFVEKRRLQNYKMRIDKQFEQFEMKGVSGSVLVRRMAFVCTLEIKNLNKSG